MMSSVNMKQLALSRFFIGLSVIGILHQRELDSIGMIQGCMFLAFMIINAWDYQQLHNKHYERTPRTLLQTLLFAYIGSIASLFSNEVVILFFLLFLLSCANGLMRVWRKKSGTV